MEGIPLPKNLLIIGAGGLGRELYSFAERHPDCGTKWILKGFLDDDFNALNGFEHPAQVVGAVHDYRPRPEDILLVGIGQPATRFSLCLSLRERGAKFLTFVHPSALVGRNVRLGDGVVLLANTNLTCDMQVGDFTIFLTGSGGGHDAFIGDCCQISSGCDIMGRARLGKCVLMGSGSRVLPNVPVGDNAVIGSGSVVIRRVAAGETVFGIPAKSLFRRAAP